MFPFRARVPLLATGTLAGCLAFLAGAPLSRADASRFGPYDVRTLFAIGKNLDRNEVQYGIRLDRECMPVGDEPVYAYWRQYEKGPEITEDLNFLDKTAYGISGQWVKKRAPEGSKVLMALKATSERGIAVLVKKGPDGKCVAESIATINGGPARLDRVYVHVAGFLKVDWIEIRGTAAGKAAVERVTR